MHAHDLQEICISQPLPLTYQQRESTMKQENPYTACIGKARHVYKLQLLSGNVTSTSLMGKDINQHILKFTGTKQRYLHFGR